MISLKSASRAERCGDAEPPQRRDEVERCFHPEPGQRQRDLVPGRPGQQAAQAGRGELRPQRRQRPVGQQHGHGQADVPVGEQDRLVPVAAQVGPRRGAAHHRYGQRRAVRAVRVERRVGGRAPRERVRPGRLQVYRAGQHQPGQRGDGAGRQQAGDLALGLLGDHPVDLGPRRLGRGREVGVGERHPGRDHPGLERAAQPQPGLDPYGGRRPEYRRPAAGLAVPGRAGISLRPVAATFCGSGYLPRCSTVASSAAVWPLAPHSAIRNALATLAGERTRSSASAPSTPYRSTPSAASASATSRVRVRRRAALGPSPGATGSSRTVRTYPPKVKPWPDELVHDRGHQRIPGHGGGLPARRSARRIA